MRLVFRFLVFLLVASVCSGQSPVPGDYSDDTPSPKWEFQKQGGEVLLSQAPKDPLFSSKILLVLAILAGLFALIFRLAFVTYRNRQKAKEMQLLASRDREIAMHREQLYVNITHELRTPLTLIISPLERLAEENPHPDILMALQHARELLYRFNELLRWNKLEAKAMTVATQVGNLADEVQKIVTQVRPIADSKQLRIQFSAETPDRWCEMDFEKLDTILSNLLMNAIKFTDRGGSIEMSLRYPAAQEKETVQLTITDSGRGMTGENLKIVFERFRQVEQSGELTEGAGIGLALVKKLISLMGGEIEVHSELNVGTSFSISLPFIAVEPQLEQLATTPLPDSTPSKRSKKNQLLIVEDNLDLQSFLASNFSAAYNLLRCASVNEAIHLTKENLPDIVVSDIMLLGGQDGIELCRTLKSDPLTSHIPVLMLTARTGAETKQRALEAGVDAYLTKPFSVRELELSLDNLLENRRMLRERFKTVLQFDWGGEHPGKPDIDPYLVLVLDNIRQELENPRFGVEQLAQAMKISRVQLFKKVKSITGMPPAELLRTIRLEKAMRLLESGAGNVSEVTYQVGFENPNYFSKAFKKHFGKTPSEVAEAGANS